MERPPVSYIIQIDDCRLGELIYYWNYYGKPCELVFRKPHTIGLAAVLVTVANDDAAQFIYQMTQKTGAKLHKK